MSVFLCGHIFFFYSLGSIYLGVKLWNNMVILCLTRGELLSTSSPTLDFCAFILLTHFVENLLGVKPALGVGDAVGLRFKLLVQGQGT